jgi:putative molybdopterin biosynthesis protein
MAVISLARRNLGFMVLPGNPFHNNSINDLQKPEIRFINRQGGSGTRVWLDIQLRKLKVDKNIINGYTIEKMTHSEVAQAILENQGNVGIGLEAVSRTFGLKFIPLTQEKFDIVTFFENLSKSPFYELLQFLEKTETKAHIQEIGGYDASETGNLRIIE